MSTINLPNVRQESDVRFKVKLTDNDVAVNWTSLTNIRAFAYSDSQRVMAGELSVRIDPSNSEVLIVDYEDTAPQYLGIVRLAVRCNYMGRQKTFDKPVINFVAQTAQATGVTVLTDPEVDVTITVTEVSTSLLDQAIAACIAATAACVAETAVMQTKVGDLDDLVTTDMSSIVNAINEVAEGGGGSLVQVQSDWTESDSTKKSYIKNKPSLAAVATSGSYNDLTNKPTIPTKTSDLENDEDFVSSADLSAVATTGSYNDLTNKPTIPADQVAVFDEDSTPEDVAAAYNAGEACFFKQPSEESFYALVHCSVDGDAALFSRAYSDAEGYHIAFIEWQVDEWGIDMVSIPDIATSITSESTNSWAAGAKAVWDLGETKQPKTTSQVLTYQASQTYVLAANKIATLDASSAASGDTITINLPASPAVTDCFDLQITIGTNAPTINWPSGISWLGGSAPTINASKKYEINIMNGFAVAGEF